MARNESRTEKQCITAAKSRLHVAFSTAGSDETRHDIQTAIDLLREADDSRRERHEDILTAIGVILFMPVAYATLCILFCL